MDSIFIFLIVATTSAITYLGARRDKRAGMREAILALLEYAGTFSLFLAVNIACGVFVIFCIRTFTSGFIALYTVENTLLVILSAAQAFVFHRSWKA